MKNDMAEAALGLLGLSSQPHITDVRAVVPLKRKSSVVFEDGERLSPLERGKESVREKENLKGRAATIAEEEDEHRADHPPPPPRQRTQPKSRSKATKPSSTAAATTTNATSSDDAADQIRCVCEISDDDGLSIACDKCGRWVHAACFGFESKTDVPEEWFCWVCVPRPVDKAKAVRAMRARQKLFAAQEATRRGLAEAQITEERGQRKISPGVERKPRRAIDGSGHTKRKRRASVSTASTLTLTTHPPVHDEDEQIDIDEPTAQDYNPIDTDIVPLQQTRDVLRRAAHSWRGATALDEISSSSSVAGPSTALRPVPAVANPSVRPPTYAVHTTQPIPSQAYIAPYTSTVLPSKQYLADPLNAYAHLSMPKPFVHLLGPPLDLALDARLTGRESRYVRSGCKPNAVLRPVLCKKGKQRAKSAAESEEEAESLTFGVFALRDLKANEEVVLGWEWDDGSVIHHLPALIKSPHLFAPLRLQQFRNQMTSMHHALSSTFTTCACGSKARDCALTRLAEFVDHIPSPTNPFSPSDLHYESRTTKDIDKTDLGPLVGTERGFRTREKIPMSGGMSGVEMVTPTSDATPFVNGDHEGASSSFPMMDDLEVARTSAKKDRKGKARATEEDMEVDSPTSSRQDSTPPSVPNPTSASANGTSLIPPRLRKRWIREKAQVLRRSSSPEPGDTTVHSVSEAGEKDKVEKKGGKDFDSIAMPPPPLPPFASSSPASAPSSSSLHTTPPSFPIVSTSPTTQFASLSLLSPAIRGPSSYFATALNPVPMPSILHTMSKPLLPSDPPVSPSLTTDDMQVDEDGPSPITSKDEPSALGEPFHRRSSPRALSIPRQPPQLIPISPSSPSPSPPSPALSVAALPSQSPPVSPFTPASVSAHLPRAEDTSSHDDQPMETELPEPEPQDASPDDSKLSPSSPPQAVSSPPLISVNDPTPEPEPEPEPAPPLPPPKKKISMGDYLSRKREAKVASPAVMVQPLMEEHEEPEKEVKEVEVEPTADVKLDVQEPPPLESPASPDPEPMVLGETEREVESSPPPSSPPAAATSRTPEPSGLDEVKFSSPTIGGDGGVAAKRENLVDTTLANFKTDLSQDASPSPIPAINGRVNVPALQDRIWSLPLESSRVEDEVDQVVEEAEAGYVESVSLRDIAAEVSKSAIAPPSLPRYNAHELSRQQSQEDGEIFSPPPQKAPPLAPRSHTPATHPRSFPSASSSTYRRGAPPSTSASYRPPPPAYHHTTPGNARPLPNAPRALRGVGNSSTSSSLSYSLSPPSRLLGPTTPRGPSGDRNRDWDRERARERVRNNSGSSWHGR